MHKSFNHQSTNLYRITLALLSLLVSMSVSQAQSVTWQALPFPSDSNWPGPTGQLASVTANGVVLDGQPARSVQIYAGPATLNCDAVLDASTSGTSALWLFLIPTGQSIEIAGFSNAVFLQLSYNNNGQDTIGLYHRNSPTPDTTLWATNYPIIVGATNHVTLGVATNGQLSLSLNGQPFGLPSMAAISFNQFQIEPFGWEPNDIWDLLNATVTTPSACPNITGTWTGQVNVADSRSGYSQTTLTLQITDQNANACLLRGYLNTGSAYNRGPWGYFNLGGLWGNVPFTGAILDTTGVIFNLGIFGQASATLDMTHTPPVMGKFILLSTGGLANGDTVVGDLTEQSSGP